MKKVKKIKFTQKYKRQTNKVEKSKKIRKS